MKMAMKRVHTSLSCAEREQFGATLKKKYEKPAMKVCELQCRPQIICSSSGDNPRWWNQPGDPEQL